MFKTISEGHPNSKNLGPQGCDVELSRKPWITRKRGQRLQVKRYFHNKLDEKALEQLKQRYAPKLLKKSQTKDVTVQRGLFALDNTETKATRGSKKNPGISDKIRNSSNRNQNQSFLLNKIKKKELNYLHRGHVGEQSVSALKLKPPTTSDAEDIYSSWVDTLQLRLRREITAMKKARQRDLNNTRVALFKLNNIPSLQSSATELHQTVLPFQRTNKNHHPCNNVFTLPFQPRLDKPSLTCTSTIRSVVGVRETPAMRDVFPQEKGQRLREHGNPKLEGGGGEKIFNLPNLSKYRNQAPSHGPQQTPSVENKIPLTKYAPSRPVKYPPSYMPDAIGFPRFNKLNGLAFQHHNFLHKSTCLVLPNFQPSRVEYLTPMQK